MEDQNTCDIIDIYALLGKKWSVPLLSRFQKDPITFNELDAISNRIINPTLLSDRLKEFVAYGILERKEFKGHHAYALTRRGEELKKVMEQFKHWAMSNKLHIPAICNKISCVCEVPFVRKHQEKELDQVC